MDHELKETLDKILELTEENNRILRKMRRSIVWGRVLHALYWVIVIGVSVGAFIYVQPFIDAFLQLLGEGNAGIQNMSTFSEFLKSFPK